MFSIIVPLDSNRLTQFKVTKLLYDAMPQKKEFVIPTRCELEVAAFLKENKLEKDVRLIPYTHTVGFNCSMALNIGVRRATFEHIVITCPEVKPLTSVLAQFERLLGNNIVCQVFDEKKNGDTSWSLVNRRYRYNTPGYYFLAMFNKCDIERINGWDEDFMNGYAYEDSDFGERWVRAGLAYWVRNDIKGIHQYHPRRETIRGGAEVNYRKFMENNRLGVVRCSNGLVKTPTPLPS